MRIKLYCANVVMPACLQREEREVSEWRRRVEEGVRLAREEASRSDRLLAQTKKTDNDRWALDLQNMEVGCCLLQFLPIVETVWCAQYCCLVFFFREPTLFVVSGARGASVARAGFP